MNNILGFDEFGRNQINEGIKNKPAWWNKVSNFRYGGYSGQIDLGDTPEERAIASTLGNIIGKISDFSAKIRDDFSLPGVDKENKNMKDLINNRKKYLDDWEKSEFKDRKVNSEILDKKYKELETKGRKNFGPNFDLFNPKSNEERVWSEYAVDILRRYGSRL